MANRFENLKKMPDGPAARFLADTPLKLETELDAPVSATVSVVLTELEEKQAWVDMLKVLAAALPAREGVWWACLAARDLPGADASPVLKATEAWVFGPTEENRVTLGEMLEAADADDETTLAATAAYYAEGNLGPGDLAEQPAPPGSVASCVLGQNLQSLNDEHDAIEWMKYLIDRAVDIANGGNGRVDKPEPKPPEPEDDDDDDDDEDDVVVAAEENAPAKG
ncbi:MAG: hypothetical protein AAGB05_02915 [Pseudomonadota bacterium]